MKNNRLDIEKRTITEMMKLFCRKQHYKSDLCPDCEILLDYAYQRLDHCPFGAEKPVCGSCFIKCYNKKSAEQMRMVMLSTRRAMLIYHPILTGLYLYHKVKFKPR